MKGGPGIPGPPFFVQNLLNSFIKQFNKVIIAKNLHFRYLADTMKTRVGVR
jgi:hypothetical protein